MTRPLRIEYRNAYYHVIARGNDRKIIFSDEKDYQKFTQLIEEYSRRFGVMVCCYVLMGNHYHLLIRTPEGNLTTFMHSLQSHYSNYYNKRHKRVGHLFQGRYRALIVEEGEYLMVLSRYIHLNPVKAGVVKGAGEWEWSSCREYMSGRGARKWISCSEVLCNYSNNMWRARKKYSKMLEMNEADDAIDMKAKGQLVVGSEEYAEWLIENIKDSRRNIDAELAGGRELMKWTKERAATALSKLCDEISEEEEYVTKKGGRNSIARKTAILMFYIHSGWRLNEIGDFFNISGSGVKKTVDRFQGEIGDDKQLEKATEALLSRFQI